ncbi:putative sporulation protein YtxC [Clostridium frigidicarnis]|uniref:Putative sporulation protein YtxC n=1 Tax=Clostridium frigidicarnis TaxID=84698 RepID=A0A1I0WK16_9CLOT|nr:putative sporulation protein YtxC [Clostridium frigidicarnis]SFA89089.1 putative sporulation protein YtxC [Clostridium frigidicarnis]
MLLLKIVYEGELIVVEELQQLKQYFKRKNITLGISESIEGTTHFIKVLCDNEIYDDKIKNSVDLNVSKILYKIIVDVFKQKEMYGFLTDTYFFLRSDELPDVSERIINALTGDEKIQDDASIYCMNRRNNIISKIKECIEENKEINISGFITFRMKYLIEDFEAIVDKVVEKYLVEKEYNEFVKLLKYFVEVQESKIDEVNIIADNKGEYHIKDKDGKDILAEFVEELVDCKLGMVGINIEDVIVSGLITNAPKIVKIHGEQNFVNKEILETIKNVFANRVVFCNNCFMCSQNNICEGIRNKKNDIIKV